MVGQNVKADCGLLRCAKVDDAYDSTMPLSSKDGQFAEVFIQRHGSSVLLGGHREDEVIARVFRPVADIYNVVASQSQFAYCLG